MRIERHLRHAITWWESNPGDFGNPVFSAPVIIPGRWSDVSEQFYDLRGRETVSRAKVTLGQEVKPGDFLYWGESAEANPHDVPGAHQVRLFKQKANLRTTSLLQEAML